LTNFNRSLLDIGPNSISRDNSVRKYLEFAYQRSTLDPTTPWRSGSGLLGLVLHDAAR
jgi:hypothetical protein